MFSNLQAFINTSFKLIKPGKVNAMGDTEDDVTTEHTCFMMDEIKIVEDVYGEEVISSSQLYMLEDIAIDGGETIEIEGRTRKVKSRSKYKWQTNKTEVVVIYL